MYRTQSNHQVTFSDFNQGCGMQLDINNDWVLLADEIDWDQMETATGYADLFPGKKRTPDKTFPHGTWRFDHSKAKEHFG